MKRRGVDIGGGLAPRNTEKMYEAGMCTYQEVMMAVVGISSCDACHGSDSCPCAVSCRGHGFENASGPCQKQGEYIGVL